MLKKQEICLIICVLASAFSLGRASAQPSINWVPDSSSSNKVFIEVAGLSSSSLRRLHQSNWKLPQWQRLLSVYAEQGDSTTNRNLPPMLGTYRVQSSMIRFEPRFPLEQGVKYRAIFRPDQLPGGSNSGDTPVIAVYRLPPRNSAPTTIVNQVYPSIDLLPENLLKFYVYFSAPMSRGRIYKHIHLKNEAGEEIELPFLEIDEELWDPTMTRLTLFIDPGRIKLGAVSCRKQQD